MDPFLAFSVAAGSVVTLVASGRWYFSVTQERLRALRKARRYSIRDFPQGGEGRIVGAVVGAPGTLIAPLSGRVCVAWAVKVHEYDAVMRTWDVIIDASEGVLLTVADDTGRALVHAHVATLVLGPDRHERTILSSAPSPALDGLLRAHGLTPHGAVFNKTLRAEEAVILPDQRVGVSGTGHRVPDPSASSQSGYREPPLVLCIDDGPDGEILVSNLRGALR